MSAGLVLSYIFIGISCWVIFLPVNLNGIKGLLSLLMSMLLSFTPLMLNLLMMPTETFLNKNLLMGLNWKYAGVNFPLYTGWPVLTFCPEAAAMPPEAFHEKADAFGQFLAANGIVHRWIVERDTAVYYFYLDPNLKLMTLGQGYLDLKYGKSLVVLQSHGEMTLHVFPADLKMFSKMQIKGPALNDLLAMFRDAARNFFIGQIDVSMQWLLNKPQPQMIYQTTKGKILTVAMPFLYVLLCILVLLLYYVISGQPDSPEKARNFIIQSQRRDGSLGYVSNCDDCLSPLWNTAAGILFLKCFGGLEKIDADAAARFLASKQRKDGMFARGQGMPGSMLETQIAMEALAKMDRTGLANMNKLTSAVATRQKPDGLWPAVEAESLSSYEATYLNLKILESAGTLNMADLEAARKALIANNDDVRESMAWYIYEIDRMSGDKPQVTKPMLEMCKKHIEYIRGQKNYLRDFRRISMRESYRKVVLLSASNDKYSASSFFLEDKMKMNYMFERSNIAPDEVGDFYPAMLAYHDLLEYKKRNPPPAWWSIRYSGPLLLWILCATALCVWFIRKEIQPL